jgi:hypothetical protein
MAADRNDDEDWEERRCEQIVSEEGSPEHPARCHRLSCVTVVEGSGETHKLCQEHAYALVARLRAAAPGR